MDTHWGGSEENPNYPYIAGGKKELMKIKVKMNEIGEKQSRSMKPKIYFLNDENWQSFSQINKKKRDKIQMIKIRNEKEDIMTEIIEIKKFMK